MDTYNVKKMALLNSLIYFNITLSEYTKLNDVIKDYYLRNPELENVTKETMMSKDKANKVLMAIKNDEELSSLRIIKSSLGVEEKDGPVHVCLVNEEKKEAIFLYRGTNGKEWLDNGEGFIKESSQLQKNALNFFEKTMKDNHLKEQGYHITVTGHSKDANKAQYVATYAIEECFDIFKDKIPLNVQQKMETQLEDTEIEVQENGLPKDNVEGELVQENAKELKKDQLETEETEVSQNEDKGRPMSLWEWQIKIASEKASTITAQKQK